jgi:Periplasmic lysozyme inhibitor of I-type lysozyme
MAGQFGWARYDVHLSGAVGVAGEIVVTTASRLVVAALCAFGSVAALGSERYVERLALSNGRVVTVAEGDDEAQTSGSYAVRLYDADHMRYRSGVIMERNGEIEEVSLADLEQNGREQIVVVLRQGPGVRSAQAFAVKDNRVEVRSHVEDLLDDADAVRMLTKTSRSDKLFGRGKYRDPNSGAR